MHRTVKVIAIGTYEFGGHPREFFMDAWGHVYQRQAGTDAPLRWYMSAATRQGYPWPEFEAVCQEAIGRNLRFENPYVEMSYCGRHV